MSELFNQIIYRLVYGDGKIECVHCSYKLLNIKPFPILSFR